MPEPSAFGLDEMSEGSRKVGASGMTDTQIRQHYEIEKELASRLRCATKAERKILYSSLYDELYSRVPFHPQLTRKKSAADLQKVADRHLAILDGFLQQDGTFLEIGPGDCALSFRVAEEVKQVYAIDVSDAITKAAATPANFELILSDGSSIPVRPGSIDIAYSNSLIEHLHPEDVTDQLQNIFDALAPGGAYVCITPNRVLGPHDVSKHFDRVATGFHLKEYTIADLVKLFRQAGFTRLRALVGSKRRFRAVPVFPVLCFEKLVGVLPWRVTQALLRFKPTRRLLRGLLGAKVVGIKPR